MKKIFQLTLFLLANNCLAQTPSIWHQVKLPPAPLLRVAQTCDGYIGQSSGGFFYTEDNGVNWNPIDMGEMTENFEDYTWIDNEQGVVIGLIQNTGSTINCYYSTSTFWSYNCQSHTFVQRFFSSDSNCWHSGGTSASVSTIDKDKFFYQKRQWHFGVGNFCQEAFVSLDGGNTWSFANCNYLSISNTDSIFYIKNDSIYLNPPGSVAKTFFATLPHNNAWAEKLVYYAGTLFALRFENGQMTAYYSSDSGATWASENLGIPYNNWLFFEEDGRLFIQTSDELYFASSSFPLVFKPIYPDHPVPSKLDVSISGDIPLKHCVSGPVWFITTASGLTFRSLDHGLSWEIAMNGLTSASSADFYFNGESPLVSVSGRSYIMQSDESMLLVDSALLKPIYPRWSWKKDSQQWIFVDKYILKKNLQTATWDTLFNVNYIPKTFYLSGEDGDDFFVVSGSSFEKTVLFSQNAGLDWQIKGINNARFFAVFKGYWYRVDYNRHLYRSNDYGQSWMSAQDSGWISTSLIQTYKGVLYAIARNNSGTYIHQLNNPDGDWETGAITQFTSSDIDAYIADYGYFLWQNVGFSNLVTHCDSSETKPLNLPCTYPFQINSSPAVFVDHESAQSYQIWQDQILAYSHQNTLWSAKLSELLPAEEVSASQEPDPNPIRIYPNPAQDQFMIEFKSLFYGKIEVLNAQGMMLRSIVLNGEDALSIKTAGLPNGFYALRLVSGEKGQCVTKWVLLMPD